MNAREKLKFEQKAVSTNRIIHMMPKNNYFWIVCIIFIVRMWQEVLILIG